MAQVYLRARNKDPEGSINDAVLIGPLIEASGSGVNHTLTRLFCRPRDPRENVLSILNIAVALSAADKLFRRADADDLWTRDLAISVPVSEEVPPCAEDLCRCLSFVSGDHWSTYLRPNRVTNCGVCSYRDKFNPDAVCLFSGGTDSLTGAINLLEQGKRVILVGHHDFSLTASVQGRLYGKLVTVYGVEKVRLEQFQVQIVDATETTTRCRSFLFMALGLAVASSFADEIPLYVPENGFMGINAPLTAGRLGSYSTRTTHPLYLQLFHKILATVGIRHTVTNPFAHLSKGEVIGGCVNPALLHQLVRSSLSCAHPTALRWQKKEPGHCGYCFPCLVRRASLHKVGLDDPRDYAFDAVGKAKILDERGPKAAALQSILFMLHMWAGKSSKPLAEVLKSGSFGAQCSELRNYVRAFSQGVEELRGLIEARGCQAVKRRVNL